METDENPNLQKADETATESAVQTQTALDQDVGFQTAGLDICSDQEIEPSSAERVGQERFSPHEQETVKPADDVGNSTATGELLSFN